MLFLLLPAILFELAVTDEPPELIYYTVLMVDLLVLGLAAIAGELKRKES